jgi:TetR/AcrR family transcriptional regulator
VVKVFSLGAGCGCCYGIILATKRLKNIHMSSETAKSMGNRIGPDAKPSARKGVGKTRRPLRRGNIRKLNQAKILKAAEAVFAEKGFDGATTAEIAARTGVPKPNIHYYFGTKQQLYDRLIANIIEVWLDAMNVIRADSDPAQAIGEYIERKVRASQQWPDSSRVWAIEIIGGGRHVSAFLRGRLRRMVKEKGIVLAQWAAEGRMDKVDPAHFFFMIWAATQTYADFGAQVGAVLGKKRLDERVFANAERTVKAIILKGCGIKSDSVE